MTRNRDFTPTGDGPDKVSPDGPVLIDVPDFDHPREYARAELDRIADAAAQFVRARGIAPGQRVGPLGANSARLQAAPLGIMRRAQGAG